MDNFDIQVGDIDGDNLILSDDGSNALTREDRQRIVDIATALGHECQDRGIDEETARSMILIVMSETAKLMLEQK
jgi:hypothetical protein